MGKQMRGAGYLVSIASVLLLGMIAWPRPEEPSWHLPALLLGIVTSILGMGMRWGASRRERAELHGVERRAGLRKPAE